MLIEDNNKYTMSEQFSIEETGRVIDKMESNDVKAYAKQLFALFVKKDAIVRQLGAQAKINKLTEQ